MRRLGRRLAREALDLAAERARGVLVERLTEALVAAGERSLLQPVPRATSEPGCYLFGITRSAGPDLPVGPGLDGAGDVEELTEGPLAAVVCQVRASLFEGLAEEGVGPRLAGLARQHDRVVRDVFDRRPVLPLRFATVLGSERDARAVLNGGRQRFLSELDRVDGRAEWTCLVRLDPSQPAPSRHGGGSNPDAGGAAYLELRDKELAGVEADDERLDRVALSLRAAVEEQVDAAVVLEPTTEGLRAAFLVSAERGGAFGNAIDEIAASEAGIRIDVEGPLPPYHFVHLELEADR